MNTYFPVAEKEPNISYIAHVRANTTECQSLEAHLRGVSKQASEFAAKFELATHGELIGLLHDLGKYSAAFQAYIQSATNLLKQDEDEEFVDAAGLKGKIDHSTCGAQFIWQHLAGKDVLAQVAGETLALCVASHHSGLIDCLTSSPGQPTEDGFARRMSKSADKTHLQEALDKADPALLDEARLLLKKPEITQAFLAWDRKILGAVAGNAAEKKSSPVYKQQIGLLVRALFSCLIDADRIDTADFEHPGCARRRLRGNYTPWTTLIARLESHLANFTPTQPIDALRKDISRHCLEAAERDTGIYTLTVPTGGGKTLASLRFALHHAQRHGLDRVIYVIPFTSIIDQNAEVVRKILEPEGVEAGSVVLEHHSNLTPEDQTWRSKILSENWDAPIVYTTMVQLLETLFGAGTRGARRMHQLANAVLVFDEIQSLPVRCVHLFNNAMNFLADHCRSTVVLCTATQPLLDQVDAVKGAIRIPPGNELIRDVRQLFDDLKRVDVLNLRKPGGWSQEDIAVLAQEQVEAVGSCLVIVNTKKAAQALYRLCRSHPDAAAFHLSTSMCPAHRKARLDEIRSRLAANPPLPTLCFSTQLIEAGVDVDFASVIRYAAGLDSIAQAAGRCNRNGRLDCGKVYVINPRDEDENLSKLPDILIGREKANRVLDDYDANPEKYGSNLIGPEAMAWYYKNYFFDRAKEMSYHVSANTLGRDDTLLNLLSGNPLAVGDYVRTKRQAPARFLRQSFMSAARAFKAIDAPTRGVIVPHGEAGKALIAELCAAYFPDKEFELLRRAQQYSVNVLPHQLEALSKANAVREIQDETGILYLADPRYYSEEFGLSDTPEGLMEVISV
ncbi:MAG TPA: CRISPR-associated helicase Cas3' [Xanthobacteraceae bacterium]|nr:CRISPR-associated helicase Cas3' [Xanthobacteraceae bacterium]